MDEEKITTIQISYKVWRKLHSLKKAPSETFDKVLRKILFEEE